MLKIISSNREYLPTKDIQGKQIERFLHLATIQDNFREFMCFADTLTSQIYIEEMIGGHLETVDDDKLMEELHNLLLFAGVLDMAKPLLPD